MGGGEVGRLLTVDEVAEALRLSPSAVYGLIHSDVLPATRIGRSIRVSEKVLANYLEAGGRAWPGGWRKRSAATV
jgi:excisionase family DNA binding protein